MTNSFGYALRLYEENAGLAAERERSYDFLGKLMKKAKRQGAMRKDARPDDVAVLFGGICRVLNERGIDDPKVWRRHTDQVVDAFRAPPA